MIGCGLGNILTAFIVARFFGAKKPTEFGSGNPGTANVGAVLGKKAGMLVYLGDAMKTLVAMLLVFLLFRDQTQLAFLYCSLGLTIGHDFPIWNHFKGGKGVAVSGIFILFINFKWGIISLVAALILMIIMKNLTLPPLLFMALMAIFAVVNHQIETAIVLAIILLIMTYQYRKDIHDLFKGTSKEVDILSGTKKKIKKLWYNWQHYYAINKQS